MADNSGNPAKLPMHAPPPRADSVAAAPAAPVALWPSQVPKREAMLGFLNDPKTAPEPFRSIASRLLSTLQFPERAAVYTSSPSADEALVQKMVVTRFRLTAAVETRAPGSAPDAASLDELVQEVDDALAAVKQLGTTTEDPELKEVCESSRTVFAKGVQELLPVAAEAHQRIAFTPPPKPAVRITSSGLPAVQPAVGRTKILVGLLVGSLLIAGAAGFLLSGGPKPLPELPPLPPNTEVFGDPSTGAVAVHSTDGKPIDPQAMARFRDEALQKGALVQEASPSMFTVTPR